MLLLLATSVWLGCGDGDQQSRDELAQSGNAICRDLRRQPTFPPARTPRELARQQTTVARRLGEGVTRFEELSPADADRPGLEAYVRSLKRQRVKTEAVVRATRQGDEAALLRLLGGRQRALNVESDRLARGLGLKDCISRD